MFAKWLIAFLALSSCGTALALTLACEQDLAEVGKTSLPKKGYARFALDDAMQCRWGAETTDSTSSILFNVPRLSTAVEIEIATYLDPNGTTATHIALLNAEYEVVNWIPFTAFRERKGSLVARFFLNPGSDTHYVLVGGAASASDQTLARTYSPLSSDLLNVAGLITARELNTEFEFIPTGKIRVRIRQPKRETVEITP